MAEWSVSWDFVVALSNAIVIMGATLWVLRGLYRAFHRFFTWWFTRICDR